jgi:hypothetical protein
MTPVWNEIQHKPFVLLPNLTAEITDRFIQKIINLLVLPTDLFPIAKNDVFFEINKGLRLFDDLAIDDHVPSKDQFLAGAARG